MTIKRITPFCFICKRTAEEVELHYCEKGHVCVACEKEYKVDRVKEVNSRCDSVEFEDTIIEVSDMNREEGDRQSP